MPCKKKDIHTSFEVYDVFLGMPEPMDGGTQHDHETSTNFLSAAWFAGSRALLGILGVWSTLIPTLNPGAGIIECEKLAALSGTRTHALLFHQVSECKALTTRPFPSPT